MLDYLNLLDNSFPKFKTAKVIYAGSINKLKRISKIANMKKKDAEELKITLLLQLKEGINILRHKVKMQTMSLIN